MVPYDTSDPGNIVFVDRTVKVNFYPVGGRRSPCSLVVKLDIPAQTRGLLDSISDDGGRLHEALAVNLAISGFPSKV